MKPAPVQKHDPSNHGDELNELALFAGAGGGILGGKLLGWRTVCAVEIDPYAREVLLARQRDGILEHFPIWDDIRTFDGNPWRGLVRVVSGGFPWTYISVAGKGAGITGEHSGLWTEMARVIGEVRPEFVLIENSPLLVSRGLDTCRLADLHALGFDAEWGCLSAAEAGAPHIRNRIWILAHSMPQGLQKPAVQEPDAPGFARVGGDCLYGRMPTDWWAIEPGVGRMVDGMAHRVDQLKALGNGQVPAVAALAWRTLHNRLTQN